MAISVAVGTERVSKIVGYTITKGNFSNTTPNLPMRIAILGEANTANQSTLSTTKKEVTSAQEAGELYGFGSPIHAIMRILRPISGTGIGGIPTIVYPQKEVAGAAAQVTDVTPTGTATGNVTHYLRIAGRDNIDGEFYSYNVETSDNAAAIIAKQVAAVNAVQGSPVIATDGTTKLTLTSKWRGVTAADLVVEVDTNDDAAGISYAVASSASGSGAVAISDALNQFGTDWNTIVINPYGVAQFTTLESFNGVPGTSPTGRYSATTFKPFIALWGSTEDSKTTLAIITDATARKDQLTNALCPAPNSDGFPYEAAANGALLFGRVSQDTPHLDVSSLNYADMPTPEDGVIGDMSDYENRDYLVQKGCSTVELINGKYTFTDFVTTYHPDGEIPPQFRYCRSLIQDWNVRFAYYLLEAINVVGHSIAASNQPVNVANVVKPKQWIQILNGMADDLGERNIISEPDFMQDSIEVGTSDTNPDRLETFFRYKRSPYARIASTTAEAGFAFGLK